MNIRRALPGTLGLLAVVILACGLFSPSVASPTATPTQAPRDTATPRPTATTRPTETLPPTPAPVGIPVPGSDIEVTVVDVIARDRIYPGGVYLYTPKAGFQILDFGVKVHNLKPGSTQSIKWSNVYIVEENGDSWYPIWGGAKMVASGATFDPFTIGISEKELVGEDSFQVEEDTYLRLVYIVQSDPPQSILFAIEDSPFTVFEP
jgi:hypothetical protein